jgi:AAA ATPase-like protein
MSGASPPVFSSSRRLLGRERERGVLDRLLEGVREGRGGGVLVMHGEAGVGKTALLDYAAEARRQFRIVGPSGGSGLVAGPATKED